MDVHVPDAVPPVDMQLMYPLLPVTSPEPDPLIDTSMEYSVLTAPTSLE